MIRAQVSRMLGCGGEEQSRHQSQGNRSSSLVSPTKEPIPYCMCMGIWLARAEASGPQCLQVSGEDHGAINTEQGMPLSFPKQDITGRGSKHFSEKEASSEESTLVVYQGRYPFLQLSLQSPAFPPRNSVTVHLPHSLPQMFLREEKGFQTVDLLNSPKTWV